MTQNCTLCFIVLQVFASGSRCRLMAAGSSHRILPITQTCSRCHLAPARPLPVTRMLQKARYVYQFSCPQALAQAGMPSNPLRVC